MTNTGKEIANLMMNNGKSASEMTHALSELGGGSMQKGFARIGKYFTEESAKSAAKGLNLGRIQGCIVGILVTATVGGTICAVAKKKEKDAAHEAEGQTILNAMKSEATISGNPAVDSESPSETDSVEKIENLRGPGIIPAPQTSPSKSAL